MSIIQVSNLSFGYEGSFTNVFENVSFQMDTDWKLGFVGRNGRGKTTFLNLLMGKYPFQGKISASTQFEYFPFFVQDPDVRTHSLVEKLAPGAASWQIEKEVSLLKLKLEVLERLFSTLSNGEQTTVLLASLFLRENRFLLIDEPTNHLDLEGRKAVSSYLNTKNGFIVVSHDRSFLDACVDHILSINKANIEVQQGNFSSWWQNKLLQDQVEKTKLKRNNKSDGMIDKGFIGHKAAKMMMRSKAIDTRRDAQVKAKSQLIKNLENEETLKLFPLDFHSKLLVDMEDVSIRYGE
jgi:lincosamide and streptogramin A transport system ATP-binding/permease protein